MNMWMGVNSSRTWPLHLSDQSVLLQALAEIEDSSSQSFRHLRKYVDDLQRCAGPEEAKHFATGWKKWRREAGRIRGEGF